MLVVRLIWFPCLHKIGRDSKFFSAGSTQGDKGWREAAAGAGARCPLRWSLSPGVTLTALRDTGPARTAPGQSATAGQQAEGHDPEVKPLPEVPPPSSTRPRADGVIQARRPLSGCYSPGFATKASLWPEPEEPGPAGGRAGKDSRLEPRSPRVPRSGGAAFASDPNSGGAGGGAASGPGLPPPPAGAFQPRAPRLLFTARGKLSPAVRSAGRLGGRRPPPPCVSPGPSLPPMAYISSGRP